MVSIPRLAILAAALLAMPLASVMAQSNPPGNYGSNRSATAAPITGDKPGTGLSTADVGSSDVGSSHKKSRHKLRSTRRAPGATGKTVVPGNHSTVADDADATAKTQTGGTGGAR